MYAYDVGSNAVPLFLGGTGANQQHTRIPDCFSGPVSGGVAVGCINDSWNTWYVTAGFFNTPVTLEMLVWPIGGNVLGGGITGVISTDRVAIGWDGFHFQAFVGSTPNNQTGTPTRQTWHHVALAADATSVLLYVDGALVVTHANAIANNADTHLAIGSFGVNGSQMKMVFAEPAAYGTKLSAARILAHYNAVDRITDLPVKLAASGAVGPPLSHSWQNAP